MTIFPMTLPPTVISNQTLGFDAFTGSGGLYATSTGPVGSSALEPKTPIGAIGGGSAAGRRRVGAGRLRVGGGRRGWLRSQRRALRGSVGVHLHTLSL